MTTSFKDYTQPHPYQIRISSENIWHNEYGAALEEFHALSLNEPEYQVELYEVHENRRWWLMVSQANPAPGRKKPWPGVRPFAGMQLSTRFFLSRETRHRLAWLGWEAPDDGPVPYSYVTPEALKNVPVLEPEPQEEEYAPLSLVAPEVLEDLARNPACRVPLEHLKRRVEMGWELVRAMSVPLEGLGKTDWTFYMDSKGRRRYVPAWQREQNH